MVLLGEERESSRGESFKHDWKIFAFVGVRTREVALLGMLAD